MKEALSTWLRVKELDEIIIIDWSSREPLRRSLRLDAAQDKKVRIFRVEGEEQPVPTYALNLALRLAAHSQVLKVACDVALSPNFLREWKLQEGQFFSTDEIVFASKSSLALVGGYSEDLVCGGHHDSNLRARLCAAGLEHHPIGRTHVSRLPCPDAASEENRKAGSSKEATTAAEQLRGTRRFDTLQNTYLSVLLPPWSDQRKMCSFSPAGDGEQDAILVRDPSPAPEPSSLPVEVADYLAFREIMIEDLALPKDLGRQEQFSLLRQPTEGLEQYTTKLRRRLKRSRSARRLLKLVTRSDTLGAALYRPAAILSKPKFYIDAQFGLGNRLRAIASAAAIAKDTDRELVIVWQPDIHCECRFEDLFEYKGAVLSKSFSGDARKLGMPFVSRMELDEGYAPEAPLPLKHGEDVYVRSAYDLGTFDQSRSVADQFLQGLQPTGLIKDLVESVRRPNDIAIHIRMVGGKGFEHLPFESTDICSKESFERITHWRQECHYSRFMSRLDELTREGLADRVFLAADQDSTYEAFNARYGDRIACLPRALYDRSAEQIKYALADMYLLGFAPVLLGSGFSSFTELAKRLSTRNERVETAGKDF